MIFRLALKRMFCFFLLYFSVDVDVIVIVNSSSLWCMFGLYVCMFLSNSPERLFICSFVRTFVRLCFVVNGAIVVLLLYVVNSSFFRF